MKMIHSNQGYTLLETLAAVGVVALMSTTISAIWVGTMRSSTKTAVKAYTDTDAVMAMQRIVTDVREASDVYPLANGDRLRIVFPKRINDGQWEHYNRFESDTAHQIDYYLSDSTGVLGHDGDWLWRGKDNDKYCVKKGIAELSFVQDDPKSVKITVVTENPTSNGVERTSLTQRVVYMRNYTRKR